MDSMVKDARISELILRLSDHYNTNISTRFLRPYIAGIFANDELARRIADLTEQPESVISQGIHLDELYPELHAMARFIFLVRSEILPNIRNLGPSASGHDSNKVYRDMALNNFAANVRVLAECVRDLLVVVRSRDEADNGKAKAVWRNFPNLSEIDRYLAQR